MQNNRILVLGLDFCLYVMAYNFPIVYNCQKNYIHGTFLIEPAIKNHRPKFISRN